MALAAAALGALLIYHACGTVAPFRDAGEFAVAARFLNVPHPPGYPFYTLLAKCWIGLIPFGNIAYRLNILSALAAAGAFYVLSLWLVRFFGIPRFWAALAALCLISTRFILGLSFVSEMYTLGLLWLAVLLYLIHDAEENPRSLALAGFLFPLALGTRLDLALAAVYALPFFPSWLSRPAQRKALLCSLPMLALGSTVFLYLPVRAAAGPLVNWGDPSSLGRLINSLIRKSHGSTVDLLSAEYARGELFWPDFRHWLNVCWATFGPLALLAPLGLFALWRQKRAWPGIICWLATVPMFCYLANLPPNPHAIKILEDHFIPGLLMAMLWAAAGLSRLGEWAPAKAGVDRARFAWANGGMITVAAAVALASLAAVRARPWSLRRNFYAHDYAVNIFRSAPPDSIVVLHEDVQLFSSWEAHLNRGRRPDLRLVAQGLSASPWYQEGLRRRWGYADLAFAGKLVEPGAWEHFARANARRKLLAGFETDVASALLRRRPQGLLVRLCFDEDRDCSGALDPWPFFIFRGSYRQDAERFFFNQDLIEDYGRAALEAGGALARAGNKENGLAFFKRSLFFSPLSVQAAIHSAYYLAERSDWPDSYFWWGRSREKLETLLGLARRYRSLDRVVAPIKRDLAYVLTSLGVASEKLGEPLQRSASWHQRAADTDPYSVTARYNLAAAYWKLKNAPAARREFEAVLRLDPNHGEAKKFLALLTSGR